MPYVKLPLLGSPQVRPNWEPKMTIQELSSAFDRFQIRLRQVQEHHLLVDRRLPTDEEVQSELEHLKRYLRTLNGGEQLVSLIEWK
jgi:hypothetical protein